MRKNKFFTILTLSFVIFSAGFAFSFLSDKSLAEVTGIHDLISGTNSYYTKNTGYNIITEVGYSYSSYHTIYTSSNPATKAKFNSVTLSAGDTDPNDSGAYGIFRIIDSVGPQTQYVTNEFYALPIQGSVRAIYPGYTADVKDLYTDLDVWASKRGVSDMQGALHRDKVAYLP